MRNERFKCNDECAHNHRMQFIKDVRPLRRLHDDLGDLPDGKVFASADLVCLVDRFIVIERPEQGRYQIFHPQWLDNRPRAAGKRKEKWRHLQEPRQTRCEMIFGAEHD